MIYPWMFEDIKALRPFAEAAEILADWTEWPVLYDPARLAANQIPLAAAIYHDDMYVDPRSCRCARSVRWAPPARG